MDLIHDCESGQFDDAEEDRQVVIKLNEIARNDLSWFNIHTWQYVSDNK